MEANTHHVGTQRISTHRRHFGLHGLLTSSEQDHANPILQSLLTSLVEQVGEPLHFWRMDGDAVLAYSTGQEFPSGEVFLSICENFYNAFTTLQ